MPPAPPPKKTYTQHVVEMEFAPEMACMLLSIRGQMWMWSYILREVSLAETAHKPYVSISYLFKQSPLRSFLVSSLFTH